jgi:hypothetical protein
MSALKLVTAPATDPITLAEAKSFLRVDSTDEDTLITTLIGVATSAVENFTGRKLISQTWDYFLDRFPTHGTQWWDGVREGALSEFITCKRFIELPLYPLVSLTYLKTYDEANSEYTMTASDYFVDTNTEPSRVALANYAQWPSTVLRNSSAIQIRCVVGYADADAVPKPLKQAILDILTGLYECRGEGEAKISKMAQALMTPYRVVRV